MKSMNKILFTFILFASITGCEHIKEIPKQIWGSSTQALEKARQDAVRRYYQCNISDCREMLYDIIQENEMTLFLEKEKENFMVLMNVYEDVTDTTEVGIFLTDIGATQTKVEITSLSSKAKDRAAQVIFGALAEKYEEFQ